MDRTARRRATHHVADVPDFDPADLRTSAGAVARALIPLVAGCPDALSAERVVSDLACAWSPEDAGRVALAIEWEEPTSVATAALHALAWTLACPDAAALVNLRADEEQLSPPWAADLGGAVPAGATGVRDGGERLAFIAFDGPQPHVLAVGVFGGRRTRFGLLRPDGDMDGAAPLALEDAAALLATALGPSRRHCSDGGPDLRHLARRRLEALTAAGGD